MKPLDWLKNSATTASEIAQVSGVSVSTVTRTFNGNIRPNPKVVDVTEDLSEGQVTANSFHRAYKEASLALATP